MVRLSDIPEETLKEIEKFVRENKMKIPVVSKGENLVDLVEKRFGYRLSPSQIYSLQRGQKTYRVKLDIGTVRELEERFGSVGKGIKEMVKFYKGQKIPDRLKEPYKALLNKGVLKSDEVEEVLLPFVKDSKEAWKIISELSRLGYVTRDKNGNFVIHKFRRDPLIELMMGFG